MHLGLSHRVELIAYNSVGMRGLDEIRALVSPPASPAGAPFDWAKAESVLGTALPADYKAYCDTYGHGGFFNGWSWGPLTPFTRDREGDLTSTYWRDLLSDHGHEMPIQAWADHVSGWQREARRAV